MSTRRNRVQSLLRLREIREERAQAQLARARAEEAMAKQTQLARREEAERAVMLPGSEMSVTLLRSLQLAGLATAENLELAKQEWERTVDRRNTASKRLQEATVGRRAMEKLAARREADVIAKRREAADRMLDELYLLSRSRESR